MWLGRERNRWARLWWAGWVIAGVLLLWNLVLPFAAGSAAAVWLLPRATPPSLPPMVIVETRPYPGASPPTRLVGSGGGVAWAFGVMNQAHEEQLTADVYTFDAQGWRPGPSLPRRARVDAVAAGRDGPLVVLEGGPPCVFGLRDEVWTEVPGATCAGSTVAVELLDGRMMVVESSGAAVHDPATHTSTPSAPPTPRKEVAAVVLADGRVAVWGTDLDAVNGRTLDLFDPITSGWTSSTWSPGVGAWRHRDALMRLHPGVAAPDGTVLVPVSELSPAASPNRSVAVGLLAFDPWRGTFDRMPSWGWEPPVVLGDGTIVDVGPQGYHRRRIGENSDGRLEQAPWGTSTVATLLAPGRVLVVSGDPAKPAGWSTYVADAEVARRAGLPQVARP